MPTTIPIAYTGKDTSVYINRLIPKCELLSFIILMVLDNCNK